MIFFIQSDGFKLYNLNFGNNKLNITKEWQSKAIAAIISKMDLTGTFYDMQKHLLSDIKPSESLDRISSEPVFAEFPFNLLLRLKRTDQPREHHPEGSVWKHTLLVVDEAAKRKHRSTDAEAFMLAALLHDIGKPDTTRNKKGRVTSYKHEIVGAHLAERFLSEFDLDKRLIKHVAALIRWHMQILFVVKNLPFADIEGMKKNVNMYDIALLGLCDRLGRGKVNIKKEEENIRVFISKTLP